jgi:Domain of unknown function (DUF892)
MMELKSLEDVFEAELKDLYSAEKQLVEALPEIAEAASSKKLTDAVSEHVDETRGLGRTLARRGGLTSNLRVGGSIPPGRIWRARRDALLSPRPTRRRATGRASSSRPSRALLVRGSAASPRSSRCG